MKIIKPYKSVVLSIFAILVLTSCHVIRVKIDAPSGGKLEDAILFVSDNGDPPRNAYTLGDIDLSDTVVTFSHTVDTTKYTHWWLIGSLNGDVVYSSGLSLNGTDVYTIAPYANGTELDWNIPNNLNSYANGTRYSLDWYAATATAHSRHATANKTTAKLWRFNNNGRFLGTINVNLKTD